MKIHSDIQAIERVQGQSDETSQKSEKWVTVPYYFNPVEHLWEHIREKYFWNRSWKSLFDLEDALSKALVDVSNAKDTVRSLSSFHWLCFNV